MAKYIKHYYVDGENLVEFFTDKNMGPNGKTHPRIDGLDVKFWFVDSNGIDYCMSVVPDETVLVPSTGLGEGTYEQWSNEIAGQFEAQRASVASNSDMLTRLSKTEAEVLAMSFDNSSVDSMLVSFAQLAPSIESIGG
jgi:hypothetical protein